MKAHLATSYYNPTLAHTSIWPGHASIEWVSKRLYCIHTHRFVLPCWLTSYMESNSHHRYISTLDYQVIYWSCVCARVGLCVFVITHTLANIPHSSHMLRVTRPYVMYLVCVSVYENGCIWWATLCLSARVCMCFGVSTHITVRPYIYARLAATRDARRWAKNRSPNAISLRSFRAAIAHTISYSSRIYSEPVHKSSPTRSFRVWQNKIKRPKIYYTFILREILSKKKLYPHN